MLAGSTRQPEKTNYLALKNLASTRSRDEGYQLIELGDGDLSLSSDKSSLGKAWKSSDVRNAPMACCGGKCSSGAGLLGWTSEVDEDRYWLVLCEAKGGCENQPDRSRVVANWTRHYLESV